MLYLDVFLLWALLCPGKSESVPEKVVTRLGSDLLFPTRIHLTLNNTDGQSCDQVSWYYRESHEHLEWIALAIYEQCRLQDFRHFTNIKISENGSLIISDVTVENAGVYNVDILNHRGYHVQTDIYTVHVEVPVSVPVLNVLCLQDGGAEISCKVEEGTEPHIHVFITEASQHNYSASFNNFAAIVGSHGPWNVTCSVANNVSRSEITRAGVTCTGEIRDLFWWWPRWGHFLSCGAVFVLYTALFSCLVTDLRKTNRRDRDRHRTWNDYQ